MANLKQIRRNVESKVVVHGYKGYPTTYLKLACGHTVYWKKGYVFFKAPKTTICNDCNKFI